MKRRHLLYATIVTLGLLFCVQAQGCGPSLKGGPGPGAQGPASGVLVGTPRVLKLPPGTAVTLVLRDRSVVTGTFLATEPVPTAEWRTRYAAVRETLRTGGPLPAPGDTVELIPLRGRSVRGTFEGFGYRTVVVRRLGRNARQEEWLDRLRAIACAGSSLPADSLLSAADRGALPSMVAIAVAVSRDTVRVPPEQVALAFAPGEDQSTAGAVIFAAMVGGALILAAVTANHQPSGGCEGPTPTFMWRPVPAPTPAAGRASVALAARP